MADPGIRITVTDMATGEVRERTIWDDYALICAGSCYQHSVESIGPTGATHVLTVKGRKATTEREDPS